MPDICMADGVGDHGNRGGILKRSIGMAGSRRVDQRDKRSLFGSRIGNMMIVLGAWCARPLLHGRLAGPRCASWLLLCDPQSAAKSACDAALTWPNEVYPAITELHPVFLSRGRRHTADRVM